MKRIATAIKVFMLLISKKDISLSLRYDEKELIFEEGAYAEKTAFLKDLQKRNNLPDHVLNQYKDVLSDFDHKNKV
ncbi:hypothetical protein FPZ43_00060 [Mucilaginibacter pallidiroseus]|uniref:Uncharacterized protein n=1 Tax=Mucilaginibacter pallidiroseus TaxID=2599295 RepID=A0A563UHP5_9SPHI|nr:hypothetical protein [Mucilaginibacter pallidiroseus]TWR30912.1 hypothetical protein FPZ43_00060 [Mucilaginibacter pallidiroseus]